MIMIIITVICLQMLQTGLFFCGHYVSVTYMNTQTGIKLQTLLTSINTECRKYACDWYSWSRKNANVVYDHFSFCTLCSL